MPHLHSQDHHHHKHHKLTPLFKEMSIDVKHAIRDIGHRPAVKEFKVELRHTEKDLKDTVADIKAVLKEAAHEIKAVLKCVDEHLHTHDASQAEHAEHAEHAIIAPPALGEPVQVFSEPSPQPEPQTPAIEATLTGQPTFENLFIPTHG